jgi:hypothetical protein
MILAPLKERCVVKMRYMKRGEVFLRNSCPAYIIFKEQEEMRM